MNFENLKVPETGKKIIFENGKLVVPDSPIIPRIKGDGIGGDISAAAELVFNEAVKKAYNGEQKIAWLDLLAGDEAKEKTGDYLPQETVDAIKHFLVAIKGPLTTPIGKGFRSLNVTMRQTLDLYACVRPVKYYEGVPNPMKKPELVNVVIFRENTEDVYAGIEWAKGTEEAKKVIDFLNNNMGKKVRADSGIGIKPMSEFGSKRIVRAAINYALKMGVKSVTIVHKGNIMKYTEGAFREWGYEVAKQEFADKIITEEEVTNGAAANGKLVIKDRIADSMFQQILLRPDEYEVIVTPNLNGDYLSDAAAAQTGGLGIAPGANINYDTGHALFEATHGTAPKYAGQDKANPGSLILSGAMMLEYIGWKEAAGLVYRGLQGAINKKTVTYDLARQMDNAKEVKCSEFGKAIVENM